MLLKGIVLAVSNIFERKHEVGHVIDGRYEVKEFLGMGSYGCSYLVFDQTSKLMKVLKILRFHKRIRNSGRKSFFREMELLKNLDHPHFPRFYEKGEYEGVPYFTMEYIKGKTFEQLIFEEGKTYTEIEAFKLGLQLLSLMESLHEVEIVHRDIRIPNVMFMDETIKLIDFGLARPLDEHNPQSDKNGLKEVSITTDYYSLGHFLLFLLYSQYEASEKAKEKSWEEELEISELSKKCIKRLLLSDIPYASATEIRKDFNKIIS
ncbi:serine/threonine protein kinase [Cytobacillus sp. FJAT-54145]|uniref:Serine/threonine protein kinase n=1 Tax=Cytobacillus spartinae TaxID=3299023 RepID=A0ABW6KD46_9BACI